MVFLNIVSDIQGIIAKLSIELQVFQGKTVKYPELHKRVPNYIFVRENFDIPAVVWWSALSLHITNDPGSYPGMGTDVCDSHCHEHWGYD